MPDSDIPAIRLRKSAEGRLKTGHVWIFSNELQDGFQSVIPGTVADILDSRGKFIGRGTVNPHSLITARIFLRERREIDVVFIRDRILQAEALRDRLPGGSRVCRLLYSEADGIPGLIIDRFEDVFVVQSNTAGMDLLFETVVKVIVDHFQPRAIIAANDAHVREFEGLSLERKLVYGKLTDCFRFQQDGITFLANPLAGQKTGFFLDQTANRRIAASFVKPGVEVLDLFSYTGGFGLYVLKAGAGKVIFVDGSESALAVAREAVEANGFSGKAEFVKVDIFDWLKRPEHQFDMVILDPPALAKSRTKVPAALRAYRDLNARAMAWVKPTGILVTASCSGLVYVEPWLEIIREAAFKSRRMFRFLARGGQSPDHPILASMPETEYLKFVVGLVDEY